MELIPGLPHDIALECLIRVHHQSLSNLASVSIKWKVEIENPEFQRRRKVAAAARSVVALVQAHVDPNRNSAGAKYATLPVYRVTLCEPETSKWYELPPVPDYPDGLPIFCHLVAVGRNLVLLGGWNPTTWEVSNSVFVYDFLSARWRRGKDMPGSPRSFFGCASDSDQTVFIAGGHDEEKNALRSAMAYDAARDNWKLLPDMARERDECKIVFHGGRFHVIGGYCTQMQGRFERSGEAFDTAAGQWSQVAEDVLNAGVCPRSCVDGGDNKLYVFRGSDVVALEGETWRTVAELPADLGSTAYVTALASKLFVVGSLSFGQPLRAHVLDLKGYTWTKVEMPEVFSGHVQSGSYMEI